MVDSRQTSSRDASSFARACLLTYLFFIFYASCYPFSGWRDTGLSPFAYLYSPFPRYWTWFDIIVNIIGYVPVGALTVFSSSSPRKRGRTVLLAIAGGAALSGMLEALQTYLPSRVPSNLDLATNTAGAFIGALAGHVLRPSLLDRGRLQKMTHGWFRPESGHALIVLALWPLAQIYPQAYLFGHGEMTPLLSEWLTRLLGSQIDLADMIRGGMRPTVEQYWLAETIITSCGLTAAVLTLWCMARRNAPKAALAMLLVLAALLGKSIASAMLFAPDYSFAWLTPGAASGLFVGAIMLYGLSYAPPVAQRRLAAILLLIGLAVVNTIPANHYFVSTLQAWSQGRFLNFNGAAHFLSLFWPILALWFLFQPIHHPKHE